MHRNHLATVLNGPDLRVISRLNRLRLACIGAAALACLLSLLIHASSELQNIIPADWPLSAHAALSALACCLGLGSLQAARNRRQNILLTLFALCAVLPVLQDLMYTLAGISFHLRSFLAPDYQTAQPQQMQLQVAAGFALLALLLPFLSVSRGFFSHTADIGASLLVINALALAADFAFGVLRVFEVPFSTGTPVATLTVLFVLTFVAFTQRAEFGVFKALLSSGIGGRIARWLAPFVIVLPFVRETARARLLHNRTLPEISTAATLASITALIALAVVVFVCRKMTSMESEIRLLSLRDELTDLYNLRGFRLLAEQALRSGQRSGTPFSVLFVDLDYLKQINDTMGHKVGSEYLVETANLLKSNFRAADVLGRIGGDEFAVAGRFSTAEIEAAVERLQAEVMAAGSGTSSHQLSLSVGYVTAKPDANQTLDDLLAEADAAMYEQKRRRSLRTSVSMISIN